MRRLLLLSVILSSAFAQPATVTIQDTPYDQFGQQYVGSVRVQLAAKSMVTGGQTILGDLATINIRSGAPPTLTMKLVPTGIGPGLPYHILTFSNGDKKNCQWATSVTPLPIAGYCTVATPGAIISPVPLSWLAPGTVTGQTICFNGAFWYAGTCGSGGGTWGSITGALSDQTDLATALAGKQATITGAPGTWPSSLVNTVFGRSVTVTAQSGDYTSAQVTESGNLYFTNARAVSALAGLYQTPITGAPGTWPSFATVATSGAYSDLSGKPTIPTNTSQIAESGNLYFTNARAVSALAGLYEVPLTFSTGLTRTANAITCDTASGTVFGCLRATDWVAFNAKQAAITTGTTLQYFRGDLSLATFPTNLNQFTNGPGFISANQSITWTAAGDASGNASGATSITPSITITGLKGAALPSLATGNLRYTGSAWTFDGTAYQTAITGGTQDQLINGAFGLTSLVDCLSAGGVYQYSTSSHVFSCHTLTVTDVAAAGTLTNATSGNAATASALASAPTVCSSGQGATGINASGAAQGCTAYVRDAGDLGGTAASPTVIALQGRSVDSGAPSDGQAIVWNSGGSKWQPGFPSVITNNTNTTTAFNVGAFISFLSNYTNVSNESRNAIPAVVTQVLVTLKVGFNGQANASGTGCTNGWTFTLRSGANAGAMANTSSTASIAGGALNSTLVSLSNMPVTLTAGTWYDVGVTSDCTAGTSGNLITQAVLR